MEINVNGPSVFIFDDSADIHRWMGILALAMDAIPAVLTCRSHDARLGIVRFGMCSFSQLGNNSDCDDALHAHLTPSYFYA